MRKINGFPTPSVPFAEGWYIIMETKELLSVVLALVLGLCHVAPCWPRGML